MIAGRALAWALVIVTPVGWATGSPPMVAATFLAVYPYCHLVARMAANRRKRTANCSKHITRYMVEFNKK